MVLRMPQEPMARMRAVGAEVRGRALDAVVTAVSTLAPATRMRVQTILADHDVLHVSPDDWYPLGEYLDTLDAIEDAVGSSVMRRVGMQIPGLRADDVDASNPGVALASLDATYADLHRGAPAGGFELRGAGSSGGTVASTTPYPDHFDRGLLEATYAGAHTQNVYARVTPAAGFGEPGVETVYDIHW